MRAVWDRDTIVVIDMTQTALAETIGISQAYLAQSESAKRVGDVTLYARLARRLGVGIEDLLPDGS